jgi:hypothetical protein
MLVGELNGEPQLVPGFGIGTMCVCEDLKRHGNHQKCGSCVESEFLVHAGKHDGVVKGCDDHAMVQTPQDPKKEDERIKKQLYQLHAASGHGHVRHMVEARRGEPAHRF